SERVNIACNAALRWMVELLGTLAFMAPEQFDHPPQCGVTSDVYSLGCTFYFLLTSRTPFGHQQDRSKEQLVHAHRSEAPAPLCSVTGDADETLIELQPVIDQMLAKDPKERQSSMTEVVARLETLATSSDCERLLATVSLDADTSAMQVDPTHGLTSLLKVGDEDSNRSKRIFRGRAGVMGVAIAILLTLGAAFAIRRLSGAWKDAFVSRESDVPIERSEGVTWKASPRTGTLDGLVLSPAKLRGIDEWQMETIAPRGHVLCLDWSRNGEYLLVTSTDGHSRVYRWDERDLRLVTIFADRRHRFFSAKWARDGHSIFAHTDGGLCKIDFSTGEIQDALELSEINQIGVHPNEPLLGVATKTGLKLVSTETLSLQANQIDGAIGRLDWSPRGDRIAVSRGDMIQIHSFEEGHFTNQPSATAVSPSPVRDIKWTPDGKHVGIARRVNPDLLRASNLRAVFRVLGPPEMESISFRDRDNKSAMGYRDTFSWYVDKKLLQRPEFEQPSGRAQVAWRPRGDCIAIGQDGLLRVLDTDGKTLSQLGGRQAIAEAASSENGRFQVVVGDHRQIELDADGRGIRSQTLAELGSQSDGDVKRRRVATTIAFDETHDLHAGNEFQIRRASDGAIIETIAVSKRYGLRHGFLCRHPSASQFISWGGDGSNSDSNGSDTLVCWDVDGISPRWSLILDGNGNAATVTPAGELIDSVGSPITSLTWIVRRGDRTTLHDRESFELLTAE
ncbi:MAG: protein kinase family protein, partial [Planctomycetota bacterium]